MNTFQDLLKVGNSEEARAKFCKESIKAFKQTRTYFDARDGMSYYNKHNLTIEQYQKTLTTLSGARVRDSISANHKLKTLFFRRLVLQQVNYVLGNGVVLENVKNKEKLGKDFDYKLMTASKSAMVEGIAFGFWNVDHLEIFGYAETNAQAGFCPFYDEKTSQLRAGARFWTRRVDDNEILRMTLYEEDGYTEYRFSDDEFEILAEKKAYIINKKTLADGTVEERTDSNYNGKLPIIPLYVNDTHESELVGIRECIDCYDLIKSGLANNIDDASEIYWILKNAGGMDDIDMAQFLQRLKNNKVAEAGDAEDIQAYTQQIPTEARKTMLEMLRKDIYEDFQALDVNTLSASAKTTQEIQASYQAQDNKCADFEYCIIDFIQQILQLAGIDDNPTFVWNRVVNQAEQTSMIMMASNYLTDEAIIKHLPFLTPEEADEIIKQREQDAIDTSFDDDNEEEEEVQTDVVEEE